VQTQRTLVSDLAVLDQSLLAKAFRGQLVPQDPSDEPADVLLARIKAAAGDSAKKPRGRGRKAT
jgi:type I restriction enzyme S subunit